MADVGKLSDAEIRTKLIEYGFPVMPITGTTRKIMVKKLRLLMDNKNKSTTDGRRSLTRYSSEEESDTDVTSTKKDKRRATMAAPPQRTSPKKGNVRRSMRSNDNDVDIEPASGKDVIKTTKRTTTTTKMTKTVQDDFDTGSDTEPELMDDDYESPEPHVYEKKDSSVTSSSYGFKAKYSPPKASSSFMSSFMPSYSSKPSSPSRFTTYNANVNTNNDNALSKLNQIRSRLSLGSTGYDRPQYASSPVEGEKVETPFLSNFTRRLSQLSPNASAQRPDYDYKNDIIKEHDTNGASSYSRSYVGRPRYREYPREYQSRQDNIVKNNLVSFAVLGVAFFFFIAIAVMYLGIRSDGSALDTAGYVIPYCIAKDANAKRGVNCLLDTDVMGAINLLKNLKPELNRRAVAFKCTDSNVKPYMTEADVIKFENDEYGMKDAYEIQENLTNLEVLIFKNPSWGISIVQTENSYITEDNVLTDMEQVVNNRGTKTTGLIVLNPDISWKCSLYNKLYAIFNTFVVVVGGFLFLYACNGGYKYYKKHEHMQRIEVCNLVERIVDMLQEGSNKEGENFLVINHVRDMIIPYNNRRNLEKTWKKAVDFIHENESRIRTEVQVVQGEPYEVWRWLGAPNMNTSGSPRTKTWQGQAFETQVGSVNSLPCSPTPCLKIRGMVDENERNTHTIREAVLNKCAHQCRILHCTVDSASSCVYLKCADQNDAAVAYRNLHGWWYAGHLVTVKYLRLERYMQRFPDSPGGPPYLKAASPATDWSS